MPSFNKLGGILILTLLPVMVILRTAFDQHKLAFPKQRPKNLAKQVNEEVSPKNLAYFNKYQVQRDDPALVDFIKREILIPPAPPSTKLNLSNPMWKSPQAETVAKLLKKKTHGFFVECGAYDGEWLSNTIELEHNFQWRGLLVEADPKYHSKLLSKKRKSWIAPVCMSPKPYPISITFQRHKEWDALSNIPEFLPEGEDRASYTIKFEAQCIPLYSLLLALNQTEVDYLSLDVEGAEWSIIQNIPFDKLRIKVISVEHKPMLDYLLINAHLKSLGYRMHRFLIEPFVMDIIYVHNTILL